MRYNPDKHHRRSIRLKHHDYSQPGVYYVTVCTQNRECLFGKIRNGEMSLNYAGRMIEKAFNRLPIRFDNIRINTFIVMPNHVHAIIVIVDQTHVGAPLVGALQKQDRIQRINTGRPQGSPLHTRSAIGQIIGAFKSITTQQYIKLVESRICSAFAGRIWQRNYYEHIIRNETSLGKIREYIIHNPENWADDELFQT